MPKPVISAKPEQLEQPVQAAPEPVQEVALPDVELSNDLLYEMLLTEFANQRGQKALAGGGERGSRAENP